LSKRISPRCSPLLRLTERGPQSPVATTIRSWPRLTSASAGLCRRRTLPTRRLLLVLLNTDAGVWRASATPARAALALAARATAGVVGSSQHPARRVLPAASVSLPRRCAPSITRRPAGGESQVRASRRTQTSFGVSALNPPRQQRDTLSRFQQLQQSSGAAVVLVRLVHREHVVRVVLASGTLGYRKCPMTASFGEASRPDELRSPVPIVECTVCSRACLAGRHDVAHGRATPFSLDLIA
jgi:hypothetical protein